ncbi:MAG: ribonuclease D [Lysobacterales bacterium]|jgi:ribonuclease D
MLITTQEDLHKLCESIKPTDLIGLDTEGDSLHSYKDKVCLIQLAKGDEYYIIDPLANIDLDAFIRRLECCDLVLHGADYDLRMLFQYYNFRPKKELFDTMFAGELLGLESINLAGLVEQFYKITIDKDERKSNWAKRPLSEKQLNYALLDVKYLFGLKEKLTELLNQSDKKQWHKECCEKLVNNTQEIKEPKSYKWRVKGSGLLTRQQLNFLSTLWSWRDKQAEKEDQPGFRILANQQMIYLSEICAKKSDLISVNKFLLPKHVKEKYHAEIYLNLKEAALVKASDWPEQKKIERVEVTVDKALIAKIKSDVRIEAERFNVKPFLILSNAVLVDILQQNIKSSIAQNSQLMDWQKKIVKPILNKYNIKVV